MTLISSLLIFAQLSSPESARLAHLDALGIGKLPIGERTARVALEFLGTPYVGGTLDRDPTRERCTVVLDGLDCVTLFETSFAIARILPRPGQLTIEAVRAEVQRTRYRDGKVTDYASRLHYTSEWFLENCRQGRVANLMTPANGAVPYNRVTNFMTENPSKYPALVHNPGLVSQLKAHEAKLNAQPRRFFPLSTVNSAQLQLLKTGDIVGICTSANGLDCSHTGLIVVSPDGTRQLLHASSSQKKVVLSSSFEKYLKTNSGVIGYMAVRPR